MIKNPTFGAALKSLWHDRCTVSTMQNSEKANSAFTQQTETVLFANEPCRLSHKTVTIATDVANAARTFQQTVLFLDSWLSIPPGSKIVVTHEGVTRTYESSGVSAVFSYHQEVPITLRRDWA